MLYFELILIRELSSIIIRDRFRANKTHLIRVFINPVFINTEFLL